MKQKKILLTFALAAMMGLAGCGESTPTPTPQPEDPPVVVVDPVVTGITLKAAGDKTSLEVGETLQLTATVTGEGDFNKQVTYSVDKTDLAEVSSAGLLTAKGKGTVRVTATAAGDTSKKASLDITITHTIVTGITISAEGDATTVELGKTLKFSAVVAGDGNFNSQYTFSVDKEDIATISNEGVLTPKAEGVVKVTAKAVGDTTKTDSLDITVKEVAVREIKDLEKDVRNCVTGKITGLTTRGFVIDDGTGAVLVFLNAKPTIYSIGDVLTVGGMVEEYHNNLQLKGALSIKRSDKTIETTTIANPTALTATSYEGIAETISKMTPVTFWGTAIKISGDYTAFKVEDASEKVIEPIDLPDTFTIETGKVYTMTGYLTAYYTSSTSGSSFSSLYVTGVTDKTFVPESVSISGEDTVRATETIKLSATVSPSRAPQDVVWSSSNNTIATVADDGTVTGVAEGPVTIIATAKDTEVKAEKTITVTAAPIAPVESVTIDKESFTLDFPAESEPLTATVLPANAPGGVTWTSSDESVAKIVTSESGAVTVKSVGKGTATITATSVGKDATDQQKTASITVTVNRVMLDDLAAELNASTDPSPSAAFAGLYGKVLYYSRNRNGSSPDYTYSVYFLIDDGYKGVWVYSNLEAAYDANLSAGDVVKVGGALITYGTDNKYYEVTISDPETGSIEKIENMDFEESSAMVPTKEDLAAVYSSTFADTDPTTLPLFSKVTLNDVTIKKQGSSGAQMWFDYGDAQLRTGYINKGLVVGKHYDLTGYIALLDATNKLFQFIPIDAALTDGYVYISAQSDSVGVGKTLQLTATMIGKENETFTWASDKEAKATVDQTGLVTGHAVTAEEETVIITATSTSDSTKKNTIALKVVESYLFILSFPDDSSVDNKVSGYGTNWNATSGNYKFGVSGFNNNNWNWTSIKTGYKQTTNMIGKISTGYYETIEDPDNPGNQIETLRRTAITDSVKKVTVEFGAVSTSAKKVVNSFVLKYGTSEAMTDGSIEKKTEVASNATVTFTISSAAGGRYYELVFDTSNSTTSGNGFIEVKKITFFD